MAIDNSFVIKHLQGLDEFYTVYSMATRLPYVECDEETFDDQIFIFAQEEDAKEFVKEKYQKQIMLQLTKVDKGSMLLYYTNLYLIGVNRLVYHDGGRENYLPIEQVVVRANLDTEPGQPPKANPTLVLTMIYYLQELRSPAVKEKKDDKDYMAKMREMEQEVIMNLSRSSFILLLDVTDVEDGKLNTPEAAEKIRFPYLKDKQGNVLQPVFTDLFEFQKFSSSLKGKIHVATIPFDKLATTMIKTAMGYTLNPGSLNMIIPRDKLNMMYEMTKEDPEETNE